jgi:uncharacterized protein YbjT (DUF2867 family)
MKKKVLVIGGTGKTGRRVADRLKAQGHEVRIGSRNQNPSFDWDNPETFTAALQGMDMAYITYHPDLAVPGAKEDIKALTEEAVKQGLKKVVLLSGKGEKEAEACEQIVADSGLDYTLVRASWFNQNFSESFFLEPILEGFVALPMANAEIPFVDADDIADVVTEVLLNDRYNGRTITVTGPRKMTLKEAVETIASSANREIGFQSISIEEYAEGMKAAGLPEDYVWLFSYLFTEVLGNSENQRVYNDLEEVLGRKSKDFSEFAKEAAATGVWGSPVLSA